MIAVIARDRRHRSLPDFGDSGRWRFADDYQQAAARYLLILFASWRTSLLVSLRGGLTHFCDATCRAGMN